MRRSRAAALVAASACALAPLGLCVLLRLGTITPAEMSVDLGPVRVATPCYSGKRFCIPFEDANPPPREVLILMDWPDSSRYEEVILVVPLR